MDKNGGKLLSSRRDSQTLRAVVSVKITLDQGEHAMR